MPLLSRRALLLRWTLPLFIALFLAMWALSFYVFFMNRRISRELVTHSWREPTTILSAANVAANGRSREVMRVYGSGWRVTPPVLIDKLPRHVADAFVAAEDVRFRRHLGVDPIGIARALFVNIRAGGVAQGGSTIPQQIVKQRFLTNDRTWRRKFLEAILAVVLDVRLTKDEMLELYLNDVYLGHHQGLPILGIDEAARLYFDKPPHAAARRRSRAPGGHDSRAEPEAARARPRAARRDPHGHARARLAE